MSTPTKTLQVVNLAARETYKRAVYHSHDGCVVIPSKGLQDPNYHEAIARRREAEDRGHHTDVKGLPCQLTLNQGQARQREDERGAKEHDH